MTTVTTRAIAKVAAVAAGLAMATSVLSLAPMAHAAALTNSQVQAILSLLTSFGADASTIANVQASLTGSTPVSTPSTPSTSACSFTKDLTIGSTGADVTCLQNTLKARGYMSANATGYFGALTKAGVIAWQQAAGITPAAGYFGAKSRAAFGGSVSSGPVTGPATGPVTTPVTGNGLKVMLATDSPNNVALVQAQAAGELAKFVFANPTASPINVTSASFKRIGVSNDSTMTNVYLYMGAKRLTDSAGISSSAFNFNDPTGIFTVPAGGSVTISVRADIANSTSGQQIGAQLVSVASNGTLDSSVVFPINSYTQTVSAATLATVDFNSSTLPSASSVDPQADYVVWQNTTTVGTRAVTLRSFAVKNIGSIQSGDLINFRLYVDGVMVGSAVPALDANQMVTFDLSAAPVRLETGGRVMKVVADVVKGASRTFAMSLRYAADAMFYDTDLNQPVLATANSSTFSARTATTATINSVSTSAPSISRATDSPTANVARGASNVKWASFKIIANGEDVKVDNINITADTSSSGSGLDNGKVFLNGVQVGSTKDLAEYGATTTNFTFGSSFIVRVGQTATIDIYADAKTSSAGDLTANETVRIYMGVGSSNGQGQVSLSSINIPASELTGNSITVASGALTATKASAYGNQTVIAGAQNIKLGSFTLSTGATEGVNVNTIDVAFASAVSSTLSDLVLKNNATGATYGTAKATIGTSNTFTGSIDIPASGTATFDIYANVKTGANAGAIPATTVSTNTTGTGSVTGSSVSVGTAATLQTITVGSATLTVTQNPGNTPDSSHVIAGATSAIKVGSFRFTTQYSPYTVDKVLVKVPANTSTSVGSVTVKYLNSAGTEVSQSAALALSSGASQTYSTATFTGMSFYVPADTNRNFDVYVTVPTVASGATSGHGITVVLDANEGFNATDSSGTADTSLAGADIASSDTTGKGTMYVRKSIVTLAAPSAATATLAAGTDQVLGKFTVAADASGDIDWGQVVFTVTKTSGVTIGATSTVALWDVTGASTQVAGTFATTTGNLLGGLESFGSGGATATGGLLHFRPTTVQTVAAGSTRTYELRGTVANLASSASNSVSVTIAAVTTSASTNAVFSSAAGTLGTSSNSSFVWSDWSDATDHASSATGGSTTDWINDYLVKTLPLTVGSRSVNL